MDVRNLFRKLKQPEAQIENDAEYTEIFYPGTLISVTGKSGEEVTESTQTEKPVNPVICEPKPVTVPTTDEKDDKTEEEGPIQVKYFTPKDNLAAPLIVEKMMDGYVVLIDISALERDMLIRLFDYVMGAMQALESEQLKIDDTHICIAPSMDDIQRFCENRDDAEVENMDMAFQGSDYDEDPEDIYEDGD